MKFLFVGERRSDKAKKMGVTWRDGNLAAKQLFDALSANGIDPLAHEYCNLFERRKLFVRKYSTTHTIVAMGHKVQSVLSQMGIEFISIVHPAARGTIRKKENYINHIKETLVDFKGNKL